MSLSSIAPTEKTENLIYTIFPLSFSIALTLFLEVKLEEGFTLIGMVTSFGAIALYQLSIDEALVKRWYRSRSNFAELKHQLSIFCIDSFLEKSESTIQTPPLSDSRGNPTFAYKVENAFQSTVSSYSIRRRFWRIRGSFYLLFSIPLLEWSFITILQQNWIGITAIIDTLSSSLKLILLLPIVFVTVIAWSFEFQLSILFTILCILFLVDIYRHRHLKRNLAQLCMYRYLQQSMSVQSILKPDVYTDESFLSKVKAEIDLLEQTILAGDWTVFNSRFTSILSTIYHEGIWKFRDNFLRDFYVSLLGYLQSLENDDARKIGWILYYGHYAISTNEEKLQKIKSKQSKSKKILEWLRNWALGIDLDKLTKPMSDKEFEKKLISDVYLKIIQDWNKYTELGILKQMSSPLTLFSTVPDDVIANPVAVTSIQAIYHYFKGSSSAVVKKKWSKQHYRDGMRLISQNIARGELSAEELSILGEILLRYTNQLLISNDQKPSGLWSGDFRWDYESLKKLYFQLSEVDERKNREDRLYFLTYFFKEQTGLIREEALGYDFWQIDLQSGPIRDYLLLVYKEGTTKHPTFAKLVKEKIQREKWKVQ